MSMIPRSLTPKLKELVGQYPIVAVTGPRQSGKTTLVRHAFADRAYVSLEDPDIREFALSDPRGFLGTYPSGAILDEAQRAPELFSYLQTRVDEIDRPGLYILTGSFNLGLMEAIGQSLAGRVAILNLLPFSLSELAAVNQAPETLSDLLFTGLYPRIHDKGICPGQWHANYIRTYIERDVRMIRNVTDLDRFQVFVRMCATRSGQLLNLTSLGEDCGITHNTAKSWLSVLQAGFILYLLKPHFKNLGKRLVKSPKLYFYDTGLLCYLLGIDTPDRAAIDAARGQIFETWVMGELVKGRLNRGLRENLWFWRDQAGHEVDCLIDQGNRLIPLEIKAGQTVTRDYFKGLLYWARVSGDPAADGYVVYGGDMDQRRENGNALGWRSFAASLPHRI